MRSSVTFLTTVAVAAFRRVRLLYATVIEDSPATDQEAPPLQGATRGCTPEA